LAVELDNWNQEPPSKGEFHKYVETAKQRITDLGKDVQALSHRLHSSKLDYLGLASAAGSFCRELAEQRKVEIDFRQSGVPRNLPKEISLSLFRVLQESLQNAVKHSGVGHFSVDLRGTPSEIQLVVNDSGAGFDQQDMLTRRGLGLISMRERLQMVSGEFSVKSEPGRGTTIWARVPLEREAQRASMAG
jgi:signal transduction histidine kinase